MSVSSLKPESSLLGWIPFDLEVLDSILYCPQYIPQLKQWIVSEYDNLDSSLSVAPWNHQNVGLACCHCIKDILWCLRGQCQCTSLGQFPAPEQPKQMPCTSLGQFPAPEQPKQISCSESASLLVSDVKLGVIEVIKCDTKLMLANRSTKPVVIKVFERLWLLIMGW